MLQKRIDQLPPPEPILNDQHNSNQILDEMIVKSTVTRTDAYFVKPRPQETEVATNKPLFIRAARQQFVEEEN